MSTAPAHEGDHSQFGPATVVHHEEQAVEIPRDLPEKFALQVTRRGETRTLVLKKHSIRSDNFQLFIQGAGGEFIPADPGPVNTYVGGVKEDPEAVVGATLTPGGITARVLSAGDGDWNIAPVETPAASAAPAGTPMSRGRAHVMFEEAPAPLDPDHQHPDGPAEPGTLDEEPKPEIPDPEFGPIPAALAPPGITSTVKQAEIAFDITNAAYVHRYGSNQQAVLDNLNTFVNNTLNTIYIRDCLIEHVLGTVVIRTDAATDPYTEHSGITSDLLSEFRYIWENNINLPASNHDLAHLQHGRGGGGLAYVGTVCGSYKYSCADGGNKDSWRGYGRHEVTHSWSLGHSPGRREVDPNNTQFGVMWPGPHERFTSDESAAVISHRNSRSCLADIGPYTAADIRPYGAWDRFETEYAVSPVRFDVLANDHDANNSQIELTSIVPVAGQTMLGTVSISAGTGSGGRDEVLYTPPAHGPNEHVEVLYYYMIDETGKTGGGRLDITLYQPFIPKPLNDDIHLADSARDWDPLSQGNNGWQYGFFDNFDNTNFTPFSAQTTEPIFDIGGDGVVWLNGTSNPRIGQFATYPTKTTVWRWTSTYQGEVELAWNTRRLDSGGDGQLVILLKNGVELSNYHTYDGRDHYVGSLFATVEIGDTIDFAIDNNDNSTSDWIYVRNSVSRRIRAQESPAPLIHYPMDLTPSSPPGRKDIISDVSGVFNHSRAHHLELDGTRVSANVDNGIEFDGTDSYLETIRSNLADGATELTISLWVNPRSKFAFEPMFVSTGPHYCGLAFSDLSGNGVQFAIGGTRWDAEASTSPQLNRWTHVVGVWKSGQSMKVYQDGVEIHPQVPVTPPTGGIDVDKWLTGRDRGSPAKYLNGSLDDILVYTRALSEGQIRTIYENGKDARNYDGVSISEDLPSPVPNGATKFTIAAWVKPRVAERYDSFLASTGNHFNGLTFENDPPRPALRIQSQTISDQDPLPLNQWSHLTGVWEAGTTMRFYVDGIRVAEKTSGIPSAPVDITGWRQGLDRSDSPWRYYDGLIQDSLIIEETLDDQQVAALHQRGRRNSDGRHGLFSDSTPIGGSGAGEKHTSASGLYSLFGSGLGFSGTSDSGYFVSHPLVTDGEITARVLSSPGSLPTGQAGVMFRQSTAANAPFVAVMQAADKSIAMRWRSTTGSSTLDLPFSVPNDGLPKWVKLARAGNTFTGSFSVDGQTWALLDTATVALGTTPLAGIISSSGTASSISRAYLSEVDISESITDPDPDLDGDGLPDAWEWFYFGDLTTTSGLPTEDFDGDLFIDRSEFTAGTSPVDPSSRLAFNSIRKSTSSPGHFTLNWQSVSGITYRIMGSSTLDGAWSPILQNITATSGTTIRDVPVDGAMHFYRIEVQ